MIVGCAEPGEAWPDWGQGPVEVEVGPGRGGFALDHAARHPERLLVSVHGDGPVIHARRVIERLIVEESASPSAAAGR